MAGAATVVFNNHQEAARGSTDASGVYVMTFDKIRIQDAIMVAQSATSLARPKSVKEMHSLGQNDLKQAFELRAYDKE